MKKYLYIALVWILPVITYGADTVIDSKTKPVDVSGTDASNIKELLEYVLDVLLDLVIPLIVSLGLISFLWGVLKFISSAGNEDKRKEGKQLMFWGIIGLFVMVSVWSIVELITGTFGFDFGMPTELPPSIKP